MSQPTEDTPGAKAENPGTGLGRQTVEFLVILSLGILLFRTFAAEAYIVPTGSMAPTLLGLHAEIHCPNCGIRFALGVDEDGRTGRPICPNCGQTELGAPNAIECSGDRLLVQKFLYDFRRPRRWEVAVFHFPGDPSQAYVKRVVGLPGEAVQLVGGDLWIDGQIARKSLAEQRAMRILVYDQQYVPRDSDRYPRFLFHRGDPRDGWPSDWRPSGTRFVREPSSPSEGPIDWIEYRHWDPDRGRYAPIHDFIPYNGNDYRGENRVDDLMFEVRLDLGESESTVHLRLDSGGDRFLVALPFGDRGEPEVRRNGRRLGLSRPRKLLGAGDPSRRHRLLEASVMDRRLTLALDGVLLFDPIDYDDPARVPSVGDRPFAIGVQGGALAVSGFRVFRDVYYTTNLSNTPRQPFGVDEPFQLGPDEFFVLGDNSPVSNDSRFWPESPVVPGELLLGKPFLVHLPGQAVPLKVFGRSLYWVPDPREIRYIR